MESKIAVNNILNQQTLGLIREYNEPLNSFGHAFVDVKENAFIYGYQGGNFGEDFTKDEKYNICLGFQAIEELFSFCKTMKNKKTLSHNNMTELMSIFRKITFTKEDDQRYSNYELLMECFGITEFWKYLSMEVRYDYSEIIECLDFRQWFETIIDQLRKFVD